MISQAPEKAAPLGQRLGQAWRQSFARRPLLSWAALAGALLLVWLLLGEALVEELVGLRQQTMALRQALPPQMAVLAREQARGQALSQQAQQARELARGLPALEPAAAQAELAREIGRLAGEQGLRVEELKPLPADESRSLTGVGFVLRAGGEYGAVLGFLRGLAASPLLVHAQDLQLSRGDAGLRLQCSVHGLWGR